MVRSDRIVSPSMHATALAFDRKLLEIEIPTPFNQAIDGSKIEVTARTECLMCLPDLPVCNAIS